MADYFRDANGQRWSLRIDDAARERILDRCFFQAPQLATYRAEAYMELYQSLLAERWKVIECLCAVCTPQAERRGITRQAFDRRLFGCYLEAEAALFYAFAEGVPENRTRRRAPAAVRISVFHRVRDPAENLPRTIARRHC